ncbi:MAG: hypothetical protein U0903_04060 [Planctomycetales bacterium]
MIAHIHTLQSHHEPHDQLSWNDVTTVELAPRRAVRRARNSNDEAIARDLLKLCLSSLGGYEEIAERSTSEEVREFAQVVLRQRWAHGHALEMRFHPFGLQGARSEFSCAEIRSHWLLAFSSLEEDADLSYLDHIERAECALEEAYLAASKRLSDPAFAEQLLDFALSVCGARQRWEEIGSVAGDSEASWHASP